MVQWKETEENSTPRFETGLDFVGRGRIVPRARGSGEVVSFREL